DELGLAFLIDSDLTAILSELKPGQKIEPSLSGTKYYLSNHPEAQPPIPAQAGHTPLQLRIERLNHRVMMLPDILHNDFYAVLQMSRSQYQTSRVIVWTAAMTVLAMLCGLSALFHRWVLYPVRLLQRGV